MSSIIYEHEQQCPYCGYVVDESQSEYEEGETEVECDRCEKTYKVVTHYVFQGWETLKMCEECGESEDECYCDNDEEDCA